MKKIYLMAATAAVVMSSCSQNVEIEKPQPEAIAFGTYVSEQNSKATPKASFVAGDKFGIFAYYTEATDYPASNTAYAPNFMFDQAVTAAASGPSSVSWSYSPIKYWPNSVNSSNAPGKVSFFAYYPKAEASSNVAVTMLNSDKTDPKINFTVNNVAKSQTDLMWGVDGAVGAGKGLPFLNKTQPAVNTDKIKFDFKHALARIGFSVALGGDILSDNSNTTIVALESIEIGGAMVGESMGDLFYTTGTLNLNNTSNGIAVWTNQSTAKQSFKIQPEASDFEIPTDGTTWDNPDESYLMVIPQNIVTATDECNIRIVYHVITTDWSLGNSNQSVVKNVKVVKMPRDINFQNGKAYTLKLTIGMTSVKMEAGDPTDWDPQPSIDL